MMAVRAAIVPPTFGTVMTTTARYRDRPIGHHPADARGGSETFCRIVTRPRI
jgi:hypothetical protein